VDVTAPVITGTPKEGITLATSKGTWSGGPTGYGYQWHKCDTTGLSCKDVGTDAASYSPTAGDIGSVIRVTVTATNAGGSGSATSAPTGPVAAPQDPVVVSVGDIACSPGDTSNNCEQSLTASLASAQHPTAVLALGDNQYNAGLLSEFNGAGAYNATWGVFDPIVYPTPGNHEYSVYNTAAGYPLAGTAQGYFNYFGAHGALHGSTAKTPYYSFNLGTWHIISLDSSCGDSGCGDVVAGETTTAQTKWLQADLASHPAACTLAYWHHPRFSGSWTNDSPGTGPLFSALYNAHADIVLGGHDHVYERFAPQGPNGVADPSGVRQFVAGTGGESLFTMLTHPATLQVSDQNDFGVLVLTLHASSYSWAFKRLNGTVVDSGSTACHGSSGATVATRTAREARLWPVGPTGPALRINAHVHPATPAAVERHGLPVAIVMSRAANVTVTVSVRRGRRSRRIAAFEETETQLSRPYTRLMLRLPARWLPAPGRGRLVVHLSAVDAAGDKRDLTRTVDLRRH
jgi:hypothetical protein